jgi:hypothetical protein
MSGGRMFQTEEIVSAKVLGQDLGHGSSGRMPAQQAQGLNSNPNTASKKKLLFSHTKE